MHSGELQAQDEQQQPNVVVVGQVQVAAEAVLRRQTHISHIQTYILTFIVLALPISFFGFALRLFPQLPLTEEKKIRRRYFSSQDNFRRYVFIPLYISA